MYSVLKIANKKWSLIIIFFSNFPTNVFLLSIIFQLYVFAFQNQHFQIDMHFMKWQEDRCQLDFQLQKRRFIHKCLFVCQSAKHLNSWKSSSFIIHPSSIIILHSSFIILHSSFLHFATFKLFSLFYRPSFSPITPPQIVANILSFGGQMWPKGPSACCCQSGPILLPS